MAWIEIHQSLLTHRKLLRLRNLLYPDILCASRDDHVTITCYHGDAQRDNHVIEDLKNMSRGATIGHLITMWLWALDNAPTGDITDLTPQELSEVVDWGGDPNQFRQSLIESGFLDNEGGKITIHNWQDYAGRLIEKRVSHAEQMRQFRAEKACASRDDHVTTNSTVPNSTVPNTDTTNVVSTRTPRKTSSKKTSTWEIPDDWQPLTTLQGYKPLDYAKTYTYIKQTCLKADMDFTTLISAFVVFYPVGQESYHWKDPVRALSNSLNVQIGKLRQRGNSTGDRYPSPTANGTRYPGNATLEEDPQEARRQVFVRKAAEMAAEREAKS